MTINVLTILAITACLCGSLIAFLFGDDEDLAIKSTSFFLISIILLLLAILWKLNPFW
jgi:hypothetical protein